MYPRYAIYAAPWPGSALARLGATWLGRDVESGLSPTPPPLSGLDPGRWMALTESPRLYGFHATLKAPFALAPGAEARDLDQAVAALAEAEAPAPPVPLSLSCHRGFFALRPTEPRDAAPLNRIEAACVTTLDRFRASPTERELARRRAPGLTQRQEAILIRWGYPFALEEFAFHMTLTGQVPAPERPAVEAALTPLLADLDPCAITVDHLSVFRQDEPDLPFQCVARHPLRGGVNG